MNHYLAEEQALQYSLDARLNYIGVDIATGSEDHDDKHSHNSQRCKQIADGLSNSTTI